jgi:hypothetical protein
MNRSLLSVVGGSCGTHAMLSTCSFDKGGDIIIPGVSQLLRVGHDCRSTATRACRGKSTSMGLCLILRGMLYLIINSWTTNISISCFVSGTLSPALLLMLYSINMITYFFRRLMRRLRCLNMQRNGRGHLCSETHLLQQRECTIFTYCTCTCTLYSNGEASCRGCHRFQLCCNWLQIMKKFLMQKMATCNRLLFAVRQLAIYGLQIGAAAVAISCGCCCK